MNLAWLLAEIGGGGGDVMGGVGYRPTSSAVSVFRDLRNQMEVARADFNRLMQEVEAFNKAQSGKLAPISDTLR